MIRPKWNDKPAGSPPQMNDILAIFFVAITVCIMAYSALVGPTAILLLYALWLPYAITYKGRRLRHSLKNNLLPAIYIAFCIGSVLWSDYRLATARASLEAASMMLCALTIPQVVSLKAFIKGVNFGVALVLIITLISGHYGMDYFSGTYSRVGLFGSKNQVGFFAEIGILGSLVYLFAKKDLWGKLMFVPIPLGLSLACLYMSRSATALASLFIVLAFCFCLRILIKLPKSLHPVAIGTTAFLSVIAIAAGLGLGWQESGFSLLGKEATLTGRTYLWSEGMKVGMDHPFLGSGFAAFWVPGQLQAEKYWFHFGIIGRSGFHFHSMFVESFVEIGVVGMILIVLLYLLNMTASLRYIMRHHIDMIGFFSLALAIMFILRAFVEVDVLGAFGVGELLFFSIMPYLNQQLLTLEGKNLDKPATRQIA